MRVMNATTLLIKLVKECEVCHEQLLKNTIASSKPSKTLLLEITKADKVDATRH